MPLSVHSFVISMPVTILCNLLLIAGVLLTFLPFSTFPHPGGHWVKGCSLQSPSVSHFLAGPAASLVSGLSSSAHQPSNPSSPLLPLLCPPSTLPPLLVLPCVSLTHPFECPTQMLFLMAQVTSALSSVQRQRLLCTTHVACTSLSTLAWRPVLFPC